MIIKELSLYHWLPEYAINFEGISDIYVKFLLLITWGSASYYTLKENKNHKTNNQVIVFSFLFSHVLYFFYCPNLLLP